jgi:hypothetical protein
MKSIPGHFWFYEIKINIFRKEALPQKNTKKLVAFTIKKII